MTCVGMPARKKAYAGSSIRIDCRTFGEAGPGYGNRKKSSVFVATEKRDRIRSAGDAAV
ncbi:MAG: hypothetical protein K6A39_01795 [Clostridiales bacterium]|nr:hypothetical protein [Clostridiales bacterium]